MKALYTKDNHSDYLPLKTFNIMSFWKGFFWAAITGAGTTAGSYAIGYGIQKGREAIEARQAAKNQPKQAGK